VKLSRTTALTACVISLAMINQAPAAHAAAIIKGSWRGVGAAQVRVYMNTDDTVWDLTI
jgi:hypothetical protein